MTVPSRRRLEAAAVSAGSFVLLGGVTGVVPNPMYVRMVPRTPLDFLFLALTAGFLGVYVLQRPASRRTDGTAATAGAALGVLAFGCPICNAVLLALFSSATLMTYFDPLRPLFGVVSVVLFAGLLSVRSQRRCESCEVDPRRADDTSTTR